MARRRRRRSPNLAPRAEAASEHYELVAIARGGDLVIYLDRFATNESVDGASIEVETPAGPQPARAKANEPYRLSAPWSSKPGSYDLIFTVTKDGDADVLPATLVIPPDDPGGKAATASLSDIAGGIRRAVIPQCPDCADRPGSEALPPELSSWR